MNLYVTCDCLHRTPVTAAKCGESVKCVCGKSVQVPPLSDLSKQCTEKSTEPDSQADTTDPHVNDLAPVRYWSMVVAGLLFVYATCQLFSLLRNLDRAYAMLGVQVAVSAFAYLAAYAMAKHSVPRP